MYDQSSIVIAASLLIGTLAMLEAGYRVGLRSRFRNDKPFASHVNTVQSSILGILALLIGFSFSLALQRFDSRSEAVVEEANAIGTAYLRSQLLPMPVRGEIQRLMRDYVDVRVRAGGVALDNPTERAALIGEAARLQDALWNHAREAAADDPGPVTSGLFIQSLNGMIDSFGHRNAELDRHVPEPVLLLLFGAFAAAGGILGFSSGIAGHRPSVIGYVMVGLIVTLMFVIIDLDRPRRGLIRVSQDSLVELRESMTREGP